MSRQSRRMFVVFGVLITCVTAAMILATTAWNVEAADEELKPDLSLNAFMRKKLDASSLILEGLSIEDAELIQKGTKVLLSLSKAEKWQVLINPEFREYSNEFRANVRKLEEAAKAGNFDNAALQWFDAMKGCIECHQHVRQERKTQ